MNNLSAILSKYDNPTKKGFDYYEVEAEIKALPKDVIATADAQVELLAMMFIEEDGCKDKNATYYGPITSDTIEQNAGEKKLVYYLYNRPLVAEYFFLLGESCRTNAESFDANALLGTHL